MLTSKLKLAVISGTMGKHKAKGQMSSRQSLRLLMLPSALQSYVTEMQALR